MQAVAPYPCPELSATVAANLVEGLHEHALGVGRINQALLHGVECSIVVEYNSDSERAGWRPRQVHRHVNQALLCAGTKGITVDMSTCTRSGNNMRHNLR